MQGGGGGARLSSSRNTLSAPELQPHWHQLSVACKTKIAS